MSRKHGQPFQPANCRRCGLCCRKGGPCLHFEDRELVERGAILLSDLFTIRRGEPARDNIGDRVVCVKEDIIKIRSRPFTTTCLFFREKDHACAVYSSRPLECRKLQCWDTKAIADVYDTGRLQRQDLLEEKPELLAATAAHQEICDYGRIGRLARDRNMTELAYLVRYDMAYRDLVVEKKLADDSLLAFLFGYPLKVTIRRYGLSDTDMNVTDG